MAGNYYHDPRPFYGLNQHNLMSMDEVCMENYAVKLVLLDELWFNLSQGFAKALCVVRATECGLVTPSSKEFYTVVQ